MALDATRMPSFGRPAVPAAVRTRRFRFGAGAVVAVVLYAAFSGTDPWPANWVPDLQGQLDRLYSWVSDNNTSNPVFTQGFNQIASALTTVVSNVDKVLHDATWIGLIAIASGAAWRWCGPRVAALVAGSFVLYGVLGLWNLALDTLALVIVSVFLALAIGIPVGILAGRRPRFDAVIAPVLDAMQILPAFAYLLPVVLLFNIGSAAGVVVTTIFAIPPAVRITSVGIRDVPATVLEASVSMGATARQQLRTVQLPLARPMIILAINQTIMLALSMLVTASIIAAGGLGDPVLAGLSVVKVGNALVPGVAIVVLAITLDRVTTALGTRSRSDVLAVRVARTPFPAPEPQAHRFRKLGGWAGAVVVVVTVVVGRVAGAGGWPGGWTTSFAEPVNRAATWVQNSLNLDAVSTFFLDDALSPLLRVLTHSPWWLVIGAAVALGGLLGGIRTALTAGVAFVVVGLLGVWDDALDTLSQVIAAGLVTVLLGIAGGIALSRGDRLRAVARPVLDAMQTMPSFVYLIPVVGLFGVGRTPAAAAAIIYALPAVIRLTDTGIRGVDPEVKEAATAYGTSSWQLLWKVELPLARPTITLAINQGLMLVLSMVIVGALVGGGALGYDVLLGLSQNKFGLGMAAGFAIVALGIALDRIARAAAGGRSPSPGRAPAPRLSPSNRLSPSTRVPSGGRVPSGDRVSPSTSPSAQSEE